MSDFKYGTPQSVQTALFSNVDISNLQMKELHSIFTRYAHACLLLHMREAYTHVVEKQTEAKKGPINFRCCNTTKNYTSPTIRDYK